MKLHDLQPDKGVDARSISASGAVSRRAKVRRLGAVRKVTGARGGGGKGAYFEGGQLPLVRRLPFKRGFTNIFRIDYQEVNVWIALRAVRRRRR